MVMLLLVLFFCFKQKTAYEMRISDWSSDVCSSDLIGMPFQRYVLWRRLLIAFDAIGGQHSATEAAHMAGFSDSAHFARTIKAMFGICASDLKIGRASCRERVCQYV